MRSREIRFTTTLGECRWCYAPQRFLGEPYREHVHVQKLLVHGRRHPLNMTDIPIRIKILLQFIIIIYRYLLFHNSYKNFIKYIKFKFVKDYEYCYKYLLILYEYGIIVCDKY